MIITKSMVTECALSVPNGNNFEHFTCTHEELELSRLIASGIVANSGRQEERTNLELKALIIEMRAYNGTPDEWFQQKANAIFDEDLAVFP